MTTELDLDAILAQASYDRDDRAIASDALINVPRLVAEVRRLHSVLKSQWERIAAEANQELRALNTARKERDEAREHLRLADAAVAACERLGAGHVAINAYRQVCPNLACPNCGTRPCRCVP